MPTAIDRTDIMEARVFTAADGTVLPYRLYIPAQSAAARLPLVLYLHGAGERGGDNRAHTAKNSVMQTLLSEEAIADYPCIVLAPQCPEGHWWATPKAEAPPEMDLTAQLLELLAQVKAEYPADETRVYITGISMGGYGTWGMLARYPELFAAAVPICGAGNPAAAARFKEIPIWVFHGAQDDVIPVQRSREMVQALTEAGAPYIRYTEYPDEKHLCWELAYREAELFPWLFAQTK